MLYNQQFLVRFQLLKIRGSQLYISPEGASSLIRVYHATETKELILLERREDVCSHYSIVLKDTSFKDGLFKSDEME